ncbi:hypothetical protein JIN85_12985 [Luteolibacter pohnpeiensis]|uniref:Uncharacterized protein n=1 Tax=Luteolibacter pohnpeiensis TaxID=454153 RepID=A0A934S8L1_9BACT|nr:hypothetical protein [Luteolibacter pohnpeiensis]MBK1883335.1 hypothetical protein [Luteolibacter pohnpeiensis]
MATKIQNPEKELRFTRAAQASIFWVAAAVFLAMGITLLACAYYRFINPSLPHPAWAALPILLAILAIRVAIRLTKHAYLIFTPLGIEIFPFFRPASTMRLVTWQEIEDAEVDTDRRLLTLHHNREKTSGIHLSLQPIPRDRRELLAKAIMGRVSRAGQAS